MTSVGAAAGAVVLGSVLLLGTPAEQGRAQAPVSSIDRAEVYRQALEAYFAGDGVEAAGRFEALTGEGPGHELAEEYLADPLRAAAPEDGAGVEPGVLLGLTGAVVVGTGAAVVVRRRRAALPAARPTGTVPAQRRPAEDRRLTPR